MTDNTKILVPYDEFAEKVKDSAELGSVKALLATEFPDDTCQLLAIKSILGMVDEEKPDEPIVEPEPEPIPDEDETEETIPPEGV